MRKGSGVMKFIDEAEAETGEKGAVVVHDPTLDDPSQAFQLSRLDTPEMTHVPMGIFRQVERPAYDDLVRSAVTTGGEVLIVQTNNASFGWTAESTQQLAMSRLRAVEHGRSTIQVSKRPSCRNL